MRRRVATIVLPLMLPVILGACANTGLRDLRTNSNGPDEFLVNRVKPLEAPTNYKDLPKPTPGGQNLTDRSALNEGVAAFGGKAQDPNGPIPASDGALLNHTRRLGVQAGIRETLAEADAKFRKRKARFTQFRIVPVDRYNQAYKTHTLDARAEQSRWRRAGAATPSSPPASKRR